MSISPRLRAVAGAAALAAGSLAVPSTPVAAAPSPAGYWMFASDGGVFAFGEARFHGSTGDINLNQPIVGMAPTPSGSGYWLVAADGGIFSFGDAGFFGSTGALTLNRPIVGMAPTPSGSGYWLVAADGGVFALGDAVYHGAAPERPAPSGAGRTVVGMVTTPSGAGYWQVSASGELLAFGDAPAAGMPTVLNQAVVGMAAFTPAAGGPEPTPVQSPGPPPEPTTTTTTTTAPGPRTPPQHFSSEPNPTWGTAVEDGKAGRVLAVAEAGGKAFLAGEYRDLVPPGGQGSPVTRPYLAALDVRTGDLVEWDAAPDGAVLALAVSADGTRLYAGGRFRSIGGGVSPRLAALDVATGRLDPTFRPPAPNAAVRSLALSGDTLYLGGAFERLGNVERPAAAVDATTGALRRDWVPPDNEGGRYTGQTGEEAEDGEPGLVYDIAVTGDGGTVLLVGDFLHFGDQGGVLALDAGTGKKTSWQPDIGRPVFGVTSWPGDDRSFFVATGGTGGQIQAFRVGGDEKPRWIHKVDGDARDVAATTERLYLVGHYDFVLGDKTVCGQPPCEGSVEDGDTPNRHISAFDAETGAHDRSFTAHLNNPQGPYVAVVGADHLYVGGDFTKVNGRPQPGFVQFPALR